MVRGVTLTVVAILSIATIFAYGIVHGGVITKRAIGAWETLALTFDPSADRYYDYGARHFDAQFEKYYDIEKAQRYFTEALKRDPAHPYANHQLARIAFLKGDFSNALTLINRQIELHEDSVIAAFYIRALIYGFMGEYGLAAKDYEHYRSFENFGWAASNDYAWVLLKADRPNAAVRVLAESLQYYPENAWLLNSYTIALYEAGHLEAARSEAQKAIRAARSVTYEAWHAAYPGNDPNVAFDGVIAIQEAARANMHTILLEMR